MEQPFIEIQSASFKYQESSSSFAIKNINMKIEKGDFIAIVGHNGSGKSTLSKHLNAMLVPSEGDVVVDGMNTKDASCVYDIRSRVGLVFQNPDNQLVSSLVEDDVAFGPENLGIDPKVIRERVDYSLESVGMENYKKDFVYELSGGQKQRVALAGVLAMNPSCIVLDEATSMLDPLGKKEVLDVLLRLNKEKNITVVMITHFMEEASLCNNIFVMKNAQIVATDTKKEIFKKEKLLSSCGLSLPVFSELVFSLKKKGIKIDEIPSSKKECIKILHSFLRKAEVHANRG